MARRRTRRKSRNRSRRRKSRRKSKRKRKSRRRKSRRRKRQRGGCGCSSGKGLFSGGNKVQVNKLNLKVMEPPVSTNNNWDVPRNPAQLGGRRHRRKKTKRKKRQRGGASLLRTIGLGDVLQGYYSATDLATNTQNKWTGRKKITSSNPIRQPKMMKSANSQYRIPNVPEYHRLSSAKAAKHVLK